MKDRRDAEERRQIEAVMAKISQVKKAVEADPALTISWWLCGSWL
jgi:hypothetical protein